MNFYWMRVKEKDVPHGWIWMDNGERRDKKAKGMKKSDYQTQSNNGQKSSEIMFKIYFKHFSPFSNTTNLCLAHWRYYRSFALLHIYFTPIFRLFFFFSSYTPIAIAQNLLSKMVSYKGTNLNCFACKLSPRWMLSDQTDYSVFV